MERLLELKGVSKIFPLGRNQYNVALHRINLSVFKGETLGIVGESGCGKSTLARIVMGVYPLTEGKIYYRDKPLKLKRRQERRAFAKHVQMVFQDPSMSLEPYMTIEHILSENLEIHGERDRGKRIQRVWELLDLIGLSKEHAGRFPHEFSGGQKQRIGIARALSLSPELVICDEPISALDTSIQSQIMNLLIRLKQELELTYIFIAHDLNMVRYISDRIAVMYAGRIVEIGPAQEIYKHPRHPYTRTLLQAALSLEGSIEEHNIVESDGALKIAEQGGCPFAPRCILCEEKCRMNAPELMETGEEHRVACFFINTKD